MKDVALLVRKHRARAARRGVTLIEVMISIGILALIGSLIYGAFDGMGRTRSGLQRIDERYHQGRQAIARMSRELQSAFISLHNPPAVQNAVRTTVFIGSSSAPYDRLDFSSFSHRKLARDRHESDQNEISYFASRDPDRGDKMDLARREQKEIDLDPIHGGVVNVAAENIEEFDVSFLDPVSGEWVETWDTTQATGQFNRMPLQVKILLVLKGGPGGQPIRFQTKASISMMTALTFGVPK